MQRQRPRLLPSFQLHLPARRRPCLRASHIFADWRDHCKPLPEETRWEACINPLLVEHKLNPVHFPIRPDFENSKDASEYTASTKNANHSDTVHQTVASASTSHSLTSAELPTDSSSNSSLAASTSESNPPSSRTPTTEPSPQSATNTACGHCHKIIDDRAKLQYAHVRVRIRSQLLT